MEKELFTISEFGKAVSVPDSTVRSWVFKGVLPVVRVGRGVRITAQTLNRIKADGLDIEPEMKEKTKTKKRSAASAK